MKFSVRLTYGCGSDLLWRYCNTLITSGFVDEVMFYVMGASGPRSKTTLCLVQFARWRHWGRSSCRLWQTCRCVMRRLGLASCFNGVAWGPCKSESNLTESALAVAVQSRNLVTGSTSGRSKKKQWRGRHRGAESAETSTPCITWGPQPQWGESPPIPQ